VVVPKPLKPHPDAAAPGTRVPSHNPLCFGCGSDHPAGLCLVIEITGALDVQGRFTVTDKHQGAPGLIHGGLFAAAFDEVLGALNWLLLVPAVTGRLETNFRQPVPVGTEVVIDATIESVSGRKVWCSGIGRVPDGSVAGNARGLFIQVPMEHFERHGRRARADVPGGKMELNP
jgi:acyl-coenzyme A thioesterase PaaI-like protein